MRRRRNWLRGQQLRGDGRDRAGGQLHIQDVIVIGDLDGVAVALAVRSGFRAVADFNRRGGGKGVLLVEYPL